MPAGRPWEETPSIPPHLVVAGRYQILNPLAEGAMGRVFEGWDRQTDRPVAIKLLRGAADPEAEARFQREATVASRVTHPGVVTVFDYGRMGSGGAFLVMERVHGQSLQALLTERGRLSAPSAVRVVRELARALHAVHAAGMVHRDVKPSNIMVESEPNADDDETRVRLLDFGVARILRGEGSEDLTPHGQVVGSVGFMAPEQAIGQDAAPPADVYALGAVLFRAVAGVMPFPGRRPTEVLRSQLNCPHPPWPRPVPEPVDRMVRHAMADDPEERPTPMELWERTGEWLEAGPRDFGD